MKNSVATFILLFLVGCAPQQKITLAPASKGNELSACINTCRRTIGVYNCSPYNNGPTGFDNIICVNDHEVRVNECYSKCK